MKDSTVRSCVTLKCASYVCSSTNKFTNPVYYLNILLHNCTHGMLRHVSTSVRHRQGALLFLAKIACWLNYI